MDDVISDQYQRRDDVGNNMNELQQQVQAAIQQAKRNLQNGQLDPDDDAKLKLMQQELADKIISLQAIHGEITAFKTSLLGHYS